MLINCPHILGFIIHAVILPFIVGQNCVLTHFTPHENYILHPNCSHNDKTAIYQHPYHARPPPPYQRTEEEDAGSKSDRKAPTRSHSHRSQSHRILDAHSSLLRRSKSVRDQEVQSRGGVESAAAHERQLSVVTFVPPSPYQSKGKI